MISTMVRNQIEFALNAHRGRDYFNARMRAMASAQDIGLSDEDLGDLATYGERYVRATLRLMEACDVAAGQARVEPLLEPVLNACTRFFLEPEDGAPDQSGLFGMMCDAYLARQLIAGASAKFQDSRGFPLLASDPHAEEAIVRNMIGAKLAETLSQIAGRALDGPQVRFALSNAYGLIGSLRASARASEWGGSWDEEEPRIAGVMAAPVN